MKHLGISAKNLLNRTRLTLIYKGLLRAGKEWPGLKISILLSFLPNPYENEIRRIIQLFLKCSGVCLLLSEMRKLLQK